MSCFDICFHIFSTSICVLWHMTHPQYTNSKFLKLLKKEQQRCFLIYSAGINPVTKSLGGQPGLSRMNMFGKVGWLLQASCLHPWSSARTTVWDPKLLQFVDGDALGNYPPGVCGLGQMWNFLRPVSLCKHVSNFLQRACTWRQSSITPPSPLV